MFIEHRRIMLSKNTSPGTRLQIPVLPPTVARFRAELPRTMKLPMLVGANVGAAMPGGGWSPPEVLEAVPVLDEAVPVLDPALDGELDVGASEESKKMGTPLIVAVPKKRDRFLSPYNEQFVTKDVDEMDITNYAKMENNDDNRISLDTISLGLPI